MSRLTVLCGLPGSGKTTISCSIVDRHGGVRLCPDEWMDQLGIDLWDEAARARIEALQWDLGQQLLLNGTDVVIEWGTWTRRERETLRLWCRAHDVVVSLVFLEVHPHELRRRLAARNELGRNVVIPLELVQHWFDDMFEPPTVEELSAYDAPTPFVSRPWAETDSAFLWEALYLSIHVREGQAPPPRSVVDTPDIGHYLVGFGSRVGDDAQVVVDGFDRPVAAAFCRRMPDDDPGYGFVSADIPEFGMAVVAHLRGRGLGRMVLTDLLARHPTMSLSVDHDNHVARVFYESLGFVAVAEEGTATTMLRRA